MPKEFVEQRKHRTLFLEKSDGILDVAGYVRIGRRLDVGVFKQTNIESLGKIQS